MRIERPQHRLHRLVGELFVVDGTRVILIDNIEYLFVIRGYAFVGHRRTGRGPRGQLADESADNRSDDDHDHRYQCKISIHKR